MGPQSVQSASSAFVSLALLVLAPPASGQQGYLFSKVLDGGAPWPGGGGPFNLGAAMTTPSFDGKWIVFRDPGPQSDGGSHAAIWSYNTQDQSLHRLVDFTTVVPGGTATFSDLELSNTAPIVRNGTVVFVAHDGGGATNQGLYAVPAAGGAVSRVANYTTVDPTGGLFTVFGTTGSQMGGFSFDGGAVVFAASGSALTSGAYSASPAAAVSATVADNLHPFAAAGTSVVFFKNPVVSGSSVVMAGTNANQTYEGLYLGSVGGNGTLTELLNSNQNLPGNPNTAFHTRFDTPMLAFDGTTVVFRAHDANTPGLGFFGLYSTDLTSHTINRIADLNTALPGLGKVVYLASAGVALHNGLVLFRATDINLNSALYQWKNGALTRLIGTGDVLAGLPVQAVGEPGTTAAFGGSFVVTVFTSASTSPALYLATPVAAGSVLTISKTHSGSFTQGQGAATYTVTVSNQASALPTSGTVIVTEKPPAGMNLVSMAGTGWACGGNQCSRNDVLNPAAAYPALTVTVSVQGNAPSQLTNQVTVSGGNSAAASAADTTVIAAAGCGATFTPQAFVDQGAQTLPVAVTAAGGCGWTSTSSAFWLIVQSASPVTGTGTVSIAVAANNTGAERTGTLSIGGSTLMVTQRQTAAIFADVPPSNGFFDAINLLYGRSITAGCGTAPRLYCADRNVTRAEMAVFIIRSVMGGDNFGYNGTPYFNDVPVAHPYFRWIQKMKELGITSGCTASDYCPDAWITRAQMAVFIIRARYGAAEPYSFPQTPYFNDVPPGDGYFSPIQKMRQVGITAGCGNTAFCPDAPATRGQMAVFLMRGEFNQLMPPGAASIVSIAPATGIPGAAFTAAISGQNTNFSAGTTQVSLGAGLTVNNIVVVDSTHVNAQVQIAAEAILGPRTVVVTTGTEEAVLPNGFRIQLQ